MKCLMPAIGCLLLAAATSLGQKTQTEPDFKPLFNGKDLDGWVRVNTAESTWSVKDGMLICTGKPIGELRTTRMYQNFILEVEWRHMKPRGNAGIFVWADDITSRGVPFHRSIEVQVLENAYGSGKGHTTHGDIFPIHGAKMTPINGRGGGRAFPTENRSKPTPEWNHYRIECRDGEISLAVNGKVVTRGKACSPSKGYVCIESEGGIVHYRNMRIKELPDTPIVKQQIAIADRGYKCLYNGIDLKNWKTMGKWQTSDWTLKSIDTAGIVSRETYEPRGFIFDVRYGESAHLLSFSVGETEIQIDPANKAVADALVKNGKWNRVEGTIAEGKVEVRLNEKIVASVSAVDPKGAVSLRADGPMDLENIYVR